MAKATSKAHLKKAEKGGVGLAATGVGVYITVIVNLVQPPPCSALPPSSTHLTTCHHRSLSCGDKAAVKSPVDRHFHFDALLKYGSNNNNKTTATAAAAVAVAVAATVAVAAATLSNILTHSSQS